jgi:predicted alpha-1,2-mannosidase
MTNKMTNRFGGLLPHPGIMATILLLGFSGCVSPQPNSCETQPAERSLVQLANPLQGTDSQRGFSHGNEYPAIALPFPMNTWAPYTQPQNDSFYYIYSQNKIRGIRQTHQPSPWIGDYANFSLMPVSGKLAVTENDRASVFSHENEIAQPGYYKVHLDTWNAAAEVTPSLRAARFRFTFEKPGDDYVVLDVFQSEKLSSVEIVPSEHKIIGVARNNRGGVPDNFGNYFVIQFDQPFSESGVWSGNKIQAGVTKLEGKHVGVFLKFSAKNRIVGCKTASSFISPQQAELNLEKEIGSADFDAVRARAEKTWNDALGRIEVSGGTLDQQKTFYSAFYRSIVYPHRFYELDESNQPIYFSPYDGKIHHGFLYTDTGYWDTFRAAHPLYNLVFPEISAEILQGIIAAYDQSGWLPEWASPGHRPCMIGDHAFSLLADGWVKGIRSFDAKKAVDAMVHDANTQAPEFCRSIGRDGAELYNSIGYVPYSNDRGDKNSFHEACAKTLEYAYDDFCAAQLAHAIGDGSNAVVFARHAMNYTNLFDPQSGFMRGRKADGSWDEPFYPEEWGGPFTEGDSWQWTWSVMQNEPGLVELLGGEKNFADKLDALFAAPPALRAGTYGRPIHEMIEMAALNMGQYAHGNEPVHHVLFLYDYVGQPWKTQAHLRQTMALLYQAAPDGLCGDEDTGQMSAWFVFSALGFYPVCPGDANYLIGSPLFGKATLHLPNGKTFTIVAGHNGAQELYIQSAALNGESFDKTFLRHEQIVNGGELKFEMGSAPNYNWGVSSESRPVSPLAPLLKKE